MSDFSSKKKIDSADSESVVEKVRERYAVFASTGSSCCRNAPTTCCGSADTVAESLGYSTIDLGLLPDGANLGLGCGAPLEYVDLEPGETMLDLGSGAGIDALIASKKVGSEGLVIGVDMTPEMLESARANADRAGIKNVDFREGRLEHLPVDDDSVDVVTSNCVINLVPDKSAVFGEIARVLRSGGRLVISDIVLDGELPEIVQKDVVAYVGCVAGAERREKYFEKIDAAGLGDVEILKDVDFLQLTEKASPAEVISIIETAGIDRKEVEGVVRSVTYRARKR